MSREAHASPLLAHFDRLSAAVGDVSEGVRMTRTAATVFTIAFFCVLIAWTGVLYLWYQQSVSNGQALERIESNWQELREERGLP